MQAVDQSHPTARGPLDIPDGARAQARDQTGARPLVDRQGHFIELQSIRGIAALVVVADHCLSYYKTGQFGRYVKDIIGNGDAAVIIFFVLSGFVLTRSLSKTTIRVSSIVNFYKQRLFRLYPAVLVATALGLIYLINFHHKIDIPDRSDWITKSVLTQKKFSATHNILAFLGLSACVIPPIWTIMVELIGSIFIPFLVLGMSTPSSWLFYLMSAVLLIISLIFGPHTTYSCGTFIIDFALGALIAKPPPGLAIILADQRLKRTRLAVSAILLVLSRLFTNGADLQPLWQIIQACISVIFLGTIVHTGMEIKFLLIKPLRALGDISFSLYLFHFPIMCFAAVALFYALNVPTFLGANVSWILLLGTTLLVSIPTSLLSFNYIELPGVALGKRFIRHRA